jgi:hypothetical protein
MSPFFQEEGYDFLGKMDVYDPNDKESILYGLRRVFDFDNEIINKKIADQVHMYQQVRCGLCWN